MSRKARISLVQFVNFCFLNFFLSLSQAEVTLTVGKGSGFTGSSNNQVEVSLENSEKVKAVTLDICDVDNYLSCTECIKTARATDFICLTNELNGCCRVVLYRGVIKSGQGAILTVKYNVSSSAPSECTDLNPENISVGNEDNEPLYVNWVPGEFCFYNCSSNQDCDDGLFCNGTDTCSNGSCSHSGNLCASGLICDENSDNCVTPTTTTVSPPPPKTTTTIGGTSSSTSSITTTTVKPTTSTTIPIPLPTTSVASTSTTTTAMSICPIVQIYGEDSLELQVLRVVRDEVLSKTPEGREIIELYYQWSPEIIKAMGENEELRGELKNIVDEILLLLLRVKAA